MSEGAIGDEFTSSEEKPKHHNEDLRYANGQRWKIQICVIGSEKSGKTSFLREFDNQMSSMAFDKPNGESKDLTIGASCDFVTKIMTFPFSEEQIKVKLWDSASK